MTELILFRFVFNKRYTNTQPYLAVFQKQREALIALIIHGFDIVIGFKNSS
uniref:Uncharacterized protein n=1 Tax=Anguilla anguilla TaxID=7936 RepID=A0A0E9S9X6_ANGAN